MLFQMFIRKVSNDRHDITETETDFIATKRTNFWLKRASAAMAKKRLCVLLTDLPNLSVSNMKRNTEKEVKTVPLILITRLT